MRQDGGEAPSLHWGIVEAMLDDTTLPPSMLPHGAKEERTVKPRLDRSPNVEPELRLRLALAHPIYTSNRL